MEKKFQLHYIISFSKNIHKTKSNLFLTGHWVKLAFSTAEMMFALLLTGIKYLNLQCLARVPSRHTLRCNPGGVQGSPVGSHELVGTTNWQIHQ